MDHPSLKPFKVKESMVNNFSKEPQNKKDDDETWMWKRNMNIGTQNVRSLQNM
jgi:hypothetical protein